VANASEQLSISSKGNDARRGKLKKARGGEVKEGIKNAEGVEIVTSCSKYLRTMQGQLVWSQAQGNTTGARSTVAKLAK